MSLFLIFIIEKKMIIITKNYNNKKKIFTFWEPSEKIPGYLKLCIKTWKKFLPDYEIEILDYGKVKMYIGDVLFSKIISKDMKLATQSDAIRVAILQKYGGIWLDTDTIILNGNFFKKIQNLELVMIGEEKYKFQYIGFIYVQNKSNIIDEWLRQIIKRVDNYKKILLFKKNNTEYQKSWEKVNQLLYLSYQIIGPLLKNISEKKYIRIDSSKVNAFPEKIFFKNSSLNFKDVYKSFYFEKREPEMILQNKVDIILLHNSWTPIKYKQMSEKEFLKQDILLSKLLSKLLGEKYLLYK